VQASVAVSLATPRNISYEPHTTATPPMSGFSLNPRIEHFSGAVASAREILEAQSPLGLEDGSSPGSAYSDVSSPTGDVSPSAHWISPAVEKVAKMADGSTAVVATRTPLSEVMLSTRHSFLAIGSLPKRKKRIGARKTGR
jgi:hypothetical protein